MKKQYITLILSLWMTLVYGQERYLEYIFDESEISVTRDVVYGQNFSALPVLNPQIGHTLKLPLMADIYAPLNDDNENRPMILYFHAGNFLPVQVNGGVNGTTRDSSVVFACKRLARLGYVVASVDYRSGWLPTHPDQSLRNFSLINAAYRGVQDAHTCIRYFKKTVAEMGNPYGINPEKIVLWGQGTGGYVALNTAALDDAVEIVTTSYPEDKFIGSDAMGNPVPLVAASINGNIFGTTKGVAPAGYAFPPAGDSLSTINHPGYSSEVQMVVNMAGAMGDLSWIDENTPPMVLFHVPSDLFAPYDSRVLLVPTAMDALPVVEVQGSYLIAKRLNELGINDIFDGIDDVYTQAAKDASAKAHNIWATGSNPETQNGHDYFEGLFPFNTKINVIQSGSFSGTYPDSAPWDFWDVDYWSGIPNSNFGGASYHQLVSLYNPDMSKEKSLAYIDTCVFYFAPRAVRALDLATSNTVALTAQDVGLNIYPNPVSAYLKLTTGLDFPIEGVRIFQLDGKEVLTLRGIKSNDLKIDIASLRSGLHFVQLQTHKGIVVEKLIIQ
ncbi:T9SS type A sorting domain-containing protein [Membranihabitans marinus]|uniref:T9SS type A sorting domain-containing protein n=1 Tax=Membranihabitans marinus TaxID=1227546 RepID=UPI001F210C8B|nr:T9SS type A sorting domain-containing protein [Membranihabitans marinus]